MFFLKVKSKLMSDFFYKEEPENVGNSIGIIAKELCEFKQLVKEEFNLLRIEEENRNKKKSVEDKNLEMQLNNFTSNTNNINSLLISIQDGQSKNEKLFNIKLEELSQKLNNLFFENELIKFYIKMEEEISEYISEVNTLKDEISELKSEIKNKIAELTK
jgi:hypothetical protein